MALAASRSIISVESPAQSCGLSLPSLFKREDRHMISIGTSVHVTACWRSVGLPEQRNSDCSDVALPPAATGPIIGRRYPNRDYCGACESSQRRLPQDAEKVSVECQINEIGQAGGADGCEQARGRQPFPSALHGSPLFVETGRRSRLAVPKHNATRHAQRTNFHGSPKAYLVTFAQSRR